MNINLHPFSWFLIGYALGISMIIVGWALYYHDNRGMLVLTGIVLIGGIVSFIEIIRRPL